MHPRSMPSRRFRRTAVVVAAVATLAVGLVGAALRFSPPAGAQVQAGPSCADPVTGAPTGPATVSAASTAFGKVLVVGSGDYAGCSLYLLTSDQLHACRALRMPAATTRTPSAIRVTPCSGRRC